MNIPISEQIYQFGEFRFNTNTLVLKYRELVLNELEKNAASQPLKILSVLLRNDEVVTYDAIISEVWGEESLYIQTNISPHIVALRKLFKKYQKGADYIKTSPGIGYRFVGATLQNADEINSDNLEESEQNLTASEETKEDIKAETEEENNADLPAETVRQAEKFKFGKRLNVIIALIIFLTILFIAGGLFIRQYVDKKTSDQNGAVIISPMDEAEIRRVVEQSQQYETLELYQNPAAFDEKLLDKYWMSEEQGSEVRKNIRQNVERLTREQTHYGQDARCEKFEFVQVAVLEPGDKAKVQTIEKWFVPKYRADGSEIGKRNVFLGPYYVDYYLKKINQNWLIEKTSTPYAKITATPTP